MLDIKLFRENPECLKEKFISRGISPEIIDNIILLDSECRTKTVRINEINAQKNRMSEELSELAKIKSHDFINQVHKVRAKSALLERELNILKSQKQETEERLNCLLHTIPNIPQDDVPNGNNEADNKILHYWGDKPEFDFGLKNHVQIGNELNLIDFGRSVKISESGFYSLIGLGARLERALINWMIDCHVDEGYTEIQVPFLVNRNSLFGTSQLPKFEDQLYKVEEDDLYLIPTAEVPVINIHSEEILSVENLPIKYVSCTPCFRREAGSYGNNSIGISRVHQFNKVEMVQFVEPEKSNEAHQVLLNNAEDVLRKLNIHYRVVLLCSGDMGFGASKCYDIEVWCPGLEKYLEVSSCSNFGDFQARRADIKFKRDNKSKPEFVHTINGSGLALPRLFISILENNQQPDGSVIVPEVLRPYFGLDKIAKK